MLKNTVSAGFDTCMTERLTLRELEEVLKKITQKKAPGPDGITNEMLKHFGPGAKRFLLHIHNESLPTGTVLTIWKEALKRPISQKKKKKKKERKKEKRKRQAGSFQLQPDQSTKLCWKAFGEDHQQKAHIPS